VQVDVSFDYRSDSQGKDPDIFSPTLKLHHKVFWSKPLPNGSIFELVSEPTRYLVHRSKLGEFCLSSDTISNSLRHQKGMSQIIAQIPSEQLDAFQALGATAGAVTLFPANKIDGGLTINVARGFNSLIGDRFDLTLECIRRHYEGGTSPLSETLKRYSAFFQLFEDFKRFSEFFLFQDLVEDGSIKYFLPFGGEFSRRANPRTVEEYYQYMKATMTFVEARRLRIGSSLKDLTQD
jgi:hypothetical protein